MCLPVKIIVVWVHIAPPAKAARGKNILFNDPTLKGYFEILLIGFIFFRKEQPGEKGDMEEKRRMTLPDYNTGKDGEMEGEIEVVELLASPERKGDGVAEGEMDDTGRLNPKRKEREDRKKGNEDNYQMVPGRDTPYSPLSSPPSLPMPYECGVTAPHSLFPEYIYGVDTPLSPPKRLQ